MQTAELTKRAKFGFGFSRSFYNVINCPDFPGKRIFQKYWIKNQISVSTFFDNFNFRSTLFYKN